MSVTNRPVKSIQITTAQRPPKFENTRNLWMPTNILTFSAKKREFWQNTFPKILHGPKASHFPWDFDSFLKVIYTKFWYASQYFNAKITISFVKAKVKPKIWKYLCQNFTRTWYRKDRKCSFFSKNRYLREFCDRICAFGTFRHRNSQIFEILWPDFAHFRTFGKLTTPKISLP